MSRATKWSLHGVSVVLAASAATLAGGVVATTAVGALTNPTASVSAARNGAPVVVEAPTEAIVGQLERMAGFKASVDSASKISAAGREAWTLIPNDLGLCVRYPDGVVGCGTTEEIKAGSFGATWIAEPADKVEDQTYPAVRRGVVPDGVIAVEAVGKGGQVLHRAAVTNNTYVLNLGLEGDTETVRTISAGKPAASFVLNK